MKPPQISNPLRVLVHEGDGAQTLAAERRVELLEELLAAGYSVSCTAGEGGVSPADDCSVVVLAEFENGSAPGAAKDETNDVEVRFVDITELDAAAVTQLVTGVREELGRPTPGSWKPWFPVIDYERCTNCMQCLSFCLFDVYGVDGEQNIEVKNADKCKTNCPACSRVCPEVAILFPKYTASPINGAEVAVEDVEREKMKVDISSLLGGDIYSMLRDRHKKAESRFSKERDESKALKERLRCLKKLGDAMDVPPEVLMALPSTEEIRANAARAAQAASEALEARERRKRDESGAGQG